ncbi:MAG: hypothetical protein CMJ76_04240 [Planctomycetaceae bacterium]|nr:hypothetical protein [Planctomycetaceae bacterium]
MAFLNSSLLFGGLLVVLPLIIHMTMRRKPVPQMFPALRFVRQNQVSNKRTLRMKQWLLLFLRCLLLAVLALALTGPSADRAVAGNWIAIGIISAAVLLVAVVSVAAVISKVPKPIIVSLLTACTVGLLVDAFLLIKVTGDQQTVLIGDADASVSAALVFDNSPRMSYQQQGKTRLQEAVEMADWLVSQLPESSEIAVLDRNARQVVFNTDLNSTMNAIEQLQIEHLPVSLQNSLRSAMELLSTSELPRRELYLFTDLSEMAWESIDQSLQATLEKHQIELFLIDVGVEKPANVALSKPILTNEVMIGQGSTELSIDVSHVGAEATRAIQLAIEEVDITLPVITDGQLQTPNFQMLAQQEVTFSTSEKESQQNLVFSLSGLPAGVHHGQVKLLGADGLSVDNVRYFTVTVEDSAELLIITTDGVPTRFFTQAIAPQSDRQTGRARYSFSVMRQGNVSERPLRQFASAVLIDPPPLTKDAWQHLANYVSDGGSLGVFLGPNSTLENLSQTEDVAELLGGKIQRLWRSDQRNFLEQQAAEHRILRDFAQLQGSVPWAQFPVVRYWQIGELSETARPIMSFSRELSHPALLENSFGRGTVITMLTPVSEPLNLENRTAWNQLASGIDNWPYFMLINAIAETLVSSRESRLNYQVGEVVALRNEDGMFPEKYQLFTPNADLQQVQAVENQIQISFIESPGAYRLKGQMDGPHLRGFSVNTPEAFSNLKRLPRQELELKLGEGNYQLARDKEDVSFGVRQRRVGQEFFSLLILLVVLLLLLEHLMASRFYATETFDAVADEGG